MEHTDEYSLSNLVPFIHVQLLSFRENEYAGAYHCKMEISPQTSEFNVHFSWDCGRISVIKITGRMVYISVP